MLGKNYPSLLLITVLSVWWWLAATNGENYFGLAFARDSSDRLKIERYSSPNYAQINSYWIETEEGIVIVDAQLFLSQARYLIDEIESQTNKPIIAVLVTHPHADHFAGLSILSAANNLAIYASRGTYNEIKSGNGGRPLTKLKELYGNDFPASEDIPLPNQIVEDGDRIEIGGIVIEAKVMENVDSPSSTVWILPEYQTAFVGDFAPDRRTPSLRGGNSANYLASLKQMRQLLPEKGITKAYPGHGEPKIPEDLIDPTVVYITYVRDRVQKSLSDNVLSEQETNEIKLAIENSFDLKYDTLLLPRITEINIQAIAEELKAEQQ